MNFIAFLRKWTLPIALTTGILSYCIGSILPGTDKITHEIQFTISIIQPLLIFAMLFLSFCKINPRNLHLNKSIVITACCQTGACFGAALLTANTALPWRIFPEAALLCFICPTATAASVVTEKLKGNMADTISYTIIINLITAILIPILFTYVYHTQTYQAGKLAWNILSHTFPTLILPMAASWFFQTFFPKTTQKINQAHNLAFYLWGVALSIAMGTTTHNIAHSGIDIPSLLIMGFISLLCCIGQFQAGKIIGRKYGNTVSCAQAFGQKNTVFAIWLGSGFMTPESAIAGGFYSIWHNLYNTYQINRAERNTK